MGEDRTGPVAWTDATMLCLRCQFDLNASRAAGRCPECGRAFDPADRRTYALDRFELRRRKLADGPARLMLVGFSALALLTLRAGFGPGTGINRSLDAGLATVVVGLVLAIRLLMMIRARDGLPSGSYRRVSPWSLVLATVLYAGAIVANTFGLTRSIAFSLHRGSLERLAAKAAPGTTIDAGLILGRVRDGFTLVDAPVMDLDTMKPSTIARITVFPVANTGYDRGDGAWCLAPGAPDSFRLVRDNPYREWRFERYDGDWFRGR